MDLSQINAGSVVAVVVKKRSPCHMVPPARIFLFFGAAPCIREYNAHHKVLHRYVPEELVTRPKTGFGVPLDSWLRGPLRDWAEDLLSRSRIEGEGFFAPAPVRRAWEEHLSGRRNHQHKLWAALMFQAWCAGERPQN